MPEPQENESVFTDDIKERLKNKYPTVDARVQQLSTLLLGCWEAIEKQGELIRILTDKVHQLETKKALDQIPPVSDN